MHENSSTRSYVFGRLRYSFIGMGLTSGWSCIMYVISHISQQQMVACIGGWVNGVGGLATMEPRHVGDLPHRQQMVACAGG